jgi:hypothetical protein
LQFFSRFQVKVSALKLLFVQFTELSTLVLHSGKTNKTSNDGVELTWRQRTVFWFSQVAALHTDTLPSFLTSHVSALWQSPSRKLNVIMPSGRDNLIPKHNYWCNVSSCHIYTRVLCGLWTINEHIIRELLLSVCPSLCQEAYLFIFNLRIYLTDF